jgi:hypothetical protein
MKGQVIMRFIGNREEPEANAESMDIPDLLEFPPIPPPLPEGFDLDALVEQCFRRQLKI